MKPKTWINWIVISGLLVVSLGVIPAARADSILRVKPDGSISWPCGDTWENACELQTALTSASAGDEIWVAAGTYKPGTNREDTFALVSGVALYGGFAGTETAREERDWEANLTLLSGDVGVEDDDSDNSYHVVSSIGVDATAVLDGFTVEKGNANGESDPLSSGGGMYNLYSDPTLTNVTFSGNTALLGGGMYNEWSNPTLTNVTFSGNHAGYYGGGIWNDNSSPTLTNVVFSDNSGGGGMYNIDNSSPTLTNVTFSGNESGNSGGGMYNRYSSNPTLTNVTFSGNSAFYGGSGMVNWDSSPTLTNVTFSGNTADVGGGMYNLNSSPTLTNVTFSGNSAGFQGGGMYNYDNSDPTLANVSFIANTAGSGGGIYNEGSSPTLTNVTFSGNTAYSSGGGMYNENNSSPTLTNVTFTGNSASYEGGGGMYNYNSNPMLTNVTFSGNMAVGGGGIYNYDNSYPTLTNAILWGNSPNQISNSGGSPAVSYSDVQGGNPGTNNIDQDPLFLRNPSPGADGNWGTEDDDYGDLRLGIGSPAIDAGNNTAPGLTGVTTDLDGNPRFVDIPGVADTGVGPAPVVDMGAYEAVNAAPVAQDDRFTTDQDVPLNVAAPGVLVNDSDPDGDTLSAELVSGPSTGSLTLNPDGSFDYLPDTGFYGEVIFTYQATDGPLGSNTAIVTITVNQVEMGVYLPLVFKPSE